MDRIKLEQAIMQCWNTKEDLELFGKRFGDHPETMTEDEVLNVIYGIMAVHEMRCEELFRTYQQVFRLDEYNWLKDI